MSDDGGRYALAGYLYQVLGYYTLIASTREKTSPENALDLTLGFEMRGARHEVHGQDALLTGIGEAGKERALLVQFKYSTRPRTYPITRSELLEIADSLHASASSAPELQGAEVAYRLVSNRSLDENAEDALKNVEAVSAKGHHKGLPDTLRRIRYRYLDEDIVHRTLKTYADQLGVLDSEFDDGIERLAGRLLMSTASMQRRTLTLADLAKGLSNCDDPRPLVGANIEDVLRQETRLFRRTARLPGGLMRRDITARIERSFDHPLILVHGDGGCGKTAAVYSIVDEALNHSGTIRFFVRMDLARMISRDWISTTVAKWQRARPERYSESAHSALARLEKAHGNKARPVLFLLLDGLDEVRSSGIDVRDAIKATLDFAFEEYELSQHTSSTPRIVVVATCRALEELDDVWPTPLEDCRATVLVGDFSRSELLSAATNALPRALSARFAASARSTGDQPDESDSLLTVDSNVLTKMPAKEEVLEALTHPLLWGLFCRLPDERTQHAVLDGDPSSLNTLCRSYIVEFSKKTRARERDLRAETTEHMLRAVAMSSSETIRLGKSKDWIGPLTAKGRFTEPNAERLFQEACSFGLVASDGSGIWRWRHAMVREYLSNEGTAEV